MSDEANLVFEGKHLLVLERDHWQFAERKKGKSAVVIIALTDEGKVVLTEQFRRPVNARVIDWPAGLVGDESGSDGPAETAKRELEEETGYRCKSVERLAYGPTSPGITSERVTFYRATGLARQGEGGGVGNEDITVHELPQRHVKDWLRKREGEGIEIDVKVWAGLYFLS